MWLISNFGDDGREKIRRPKVLTSRFILGNNRILRGPTLVLGTRYPESFLEEVPQGS